MNGIKKTNETKYCTTEDQYEKVEENILFMNTHDSGVTNIFNATRLKLRILFQSLKMKKRWLVKIS